MQGLTAALDRRQKPLTVFFRDDDAGWQTPRLEAFLEVFADNDCPVDLAVIPAALDRGTANCLRLWRKRHSVIGLHQHGYGHLNHEPEGKRKCEFGPARPVERQCADIMIGRERLTAMLGAVDPIFTPPWNRCVPETIERLSAMGFAAFSDDGKASPSNKGPKHLPVNFDWDRARNQGQELSAFQTLLESAPERAGIMLHHATMPSPSLDALSQILRQIRSHPNLRCINMRDLLETPL